MGEKLVRIYEIVTEKMGLSGRLALASKVGIPMSQAAEIEDTEELVSKFKYAASDIYEESVKKQSK